ncbi:hypothetical protein BLNAU_12620 [Blattamonas nauphoetae]|uniref:Uncharacterized protein n=1 Tax=Blattamonas nauphoetae TaxID=2049346 RepID=A0ABQ9XPH9_9EUKA|nr:hypothetical protein BLNAU_12620 [Blattamonas nauphoetae]
MTPCPTAESERAMILNLIVKPSKGHIIPCTSVCKRAHPDNVTFNPSDCFNAVVVKEIPLDFFSTVYVSSAEQLDKESSDLHWVKP